MLPLKASVQLLELVNTSYFIGRHMSCDLVVKDLSVSNKHFEVFRESTKEIRGGTKNIGCPVFLRDLSSNGTYLNGQKIGKGNKVLLRTNDEISLAQRKNKTFMFQDYSDQDDSSNLSSDEGIFSRYYITKTLGNGNFAEVKLAIEKSSAKQYAVKIIDKKKMFLHPSLQDSLKHEVSILKSVCHPSITAVHDVFETDAVLYIVLELVTGGELFDKIVNDGHFTETDSKFLFYQMLVAVKYLHDNGISHRDLKPENVLLSSKTIDKCVVKITDFGLAKLVGENSFMKTVCGTPNYLAPEVVTIAGGRNEGSYDKAVDCWSLGVILYICLCGLPPFNDESQGHSLHEQITQGLYEFTESDWRHVSACAKNLVTKLLTVDPKKRISVDEALKHPWMKDPVLPRKYEEALRASGEIVPQSVSAASAASNQMISPMGPPAPVPTSCKAVKRPAPPPNATRSPFQPLNSSTETCRDDGGTFKEPERKRLSKEFIKDQAVPKTN